MYQNGRTDVEVCSLEITPPLLAGLQRSARHIRAESLQADQPFLLTLQDRRALQACGCHDQPLADFPTYSRVRVQQSKSTAVQRTVLEIIAGASERCNFSHLLTAGVGRKPTRGIEGRVEARSRRCRTAIYGRTGERRRHHDGRSPP